MPGPETVRFGGNTPCLEVRSPTGQILILDAGTGIRGLGQHLATNDDDVTADLFISHFHWDHIQGLPFFEPLHDPHTRLRVHAASQDGTDIRTLFARQLEPVHFPVPYDALAAELEFNAITDQPWHEGELEVTAFRLRHPSHTFGYRVRSGSATLAYIPDNELIGADYPVSADWYDELVTFLHGADILFHDAMYTDDEYTRRVGWGHSTFHQAIALAEAAAVRRLCLFHHAPDRSDDELEAIVETLRSEQTNGEALQIHAAIEGETLDISTSAERGDRSNPRDHAPASTDREAEPAKTTDQSAGRPGPHGERIQ